MPGGVNSPVRAFAAVGGEPVFIRKGKGARVTDVDGNTYIDYVLSYGPLILGHAADSVVVAVNKAASTGTSFGMPTEGENTLAQMIIEAVPSIELVRLVNSGTEAVMSAIRLARAATNRSRIIKFIGCYHGHSDALLVQAGSGATTLGVPSSPGVPEAITSHTLLVPYNDAEAVAAAFAEHGEQIAAVVVEPIAGNMGCVPPREGFLQRLRDLCDQYRSLLIFDEVMTGFRVAYGGAQALYGITPDLTCLGKIVGGGLPCAAYGGRESIMRLIAPDGPVYQAGTLSGNPLAVAAGIAMLENLRDGKAYTQLEETSARLAEGLQRAAERFGIEATINRVGSMLTVFFGPGPIENYAAATACDTAAFATFFHTMLAEGVILPPSQFEAWFLSTTHDDECIQQTIAAAESAFKAVSETRMSK